MLGNLKKHFRQNGVKLEKEIKKNYLLFFKRIQSIKSKYHSSLIHSLLEWKD